MRHALPAAALILAVSAPLSAAAQTAQPPAPSSSAGHWKLDDMQVIGSNGQKVGEVEEALIDAAGKVSAVVIDVGGVMGVGEKEVVLQLDQLRFENGRLVTSLTKEQAEALPNWEKR